jgi:hypothetical protein
VKFSINCNEPLGELATQSLQQLWGEAFADLSSEVLAAAFAKTLRTCRFFPKVADVRAAIDAATQNARQEAAELAWQRVLDLRRLHWNPDLPDRLSRELARFPEQIRQAARAAGVFRDFESVEALHTWAKRRFIESFNSWAELEQDRYLLPDGEIKWLFADVAATKSLPASEESWEAMRQRGLSYTAQLKAPASQTRQADPPRPRLCAQPPRSLEEQKRILRERGWLPKTEGLQTSASRA